MFCYQCGKGMLFGMSRTHHRGVAGGRWKKRAPRTVRVFRPNLQNIKIIENGKTIAVSLCTKCLKRVKKDIADKVTPFVKLANS